jgi:hypothetical protein
LDVEAGSSGLQHENKLKIRTVTRKYDARIT